MENDYTFLQSGGIDASWMTPEQAKQAAEEMRRQQALLKPAPPRSAIDDLRALGEGIGGIGKQLVGTALDTVTSVPLDVAAAGTGVVESGAHLTGTGVDTLKRLGVTGDTPSEGLSARFAEGAQRARDEVNQAVGEPKNTLEQLARGDVVTPISDLWDELLELRGAPQRPPVDEIPELPIDKQPPRGPVFPPADAEEDQALKDLRAFVKAESIPNIGEADMVLDTPIGPIKVGREEWVALGLGSLTTLGAMLAPGLRAKMKGTVPPPKRTPVAVPDAHPETLGGSTRVDLARTYDDANAGLFRYADAMGMNKQVLDEVEKAFDVHSGAAARGLADAAIATGDMTIAGIRYRAPPLARLKLLDTPDARQYLHLRYLLDEIRIGPNKRLSPHGNVQSAVYNMQNNPRPSVQGMTEQDLLRQVNVLEAANPGLRQIALEYRTNVREARRFMSTGEFATMSHREQQALNIAYPNEIPYKQKALDQAVDQGDPFNALMVDVRHNIRDRLENEAKGQYVDAMRRLNPRLMRKITRRQYEENPSWHQNTVTIYRRGRKEYYTTDPLVADVLKFDPYFIKGDVLSGTKNLFEMATTGSLAPWFAVTSAIRSFRQGKINAPEGFVGPSILGTLSAIPEQLVPQIAKLMSDSISRGSAWRGMEDVLGQNVINNLGRIGASVYDKSLFAAAKARGGVNTSIYYKEVDDATSNLTKIAKRGGTQQHRMLEGLMGLLNGTWSSYKAALNAVHSAPMHSFLKRNWDVIKDKDELMRQARQFAGDPHVRGMAYKGQEKAPVRALATETSEGLVDAGLDKLTRVYGGVTEAGRLAIPWYNYTVAGMKQAGKAYLRNPSKFVARAWLYGALPSAMVYLYNHALSQTEEAKANGWDYNEKARGQYGYLMNDSIGKPGEPPENNMAIPRYHEFSVVSALMTTWLDHLFREQDFTLPEDMANVFDQWIDTTVSPPIPPLIGAGFGLAGKQPPMGAFAFSDTYEIDKEAFVDHFPAWVDGVTRALGGGAADIFGKMALAYTNTEEGVAKAIDNAAAQAGQDMASRTPILRDLLGLDMRRSSDTQIGDAAYAGNDFIKEISEYYKKYSVNEGKINVDPLSAEGNAAAGEWLKKYGEDEDTGMVPPDYTGTLPKIPDNPLYHALMDSFYKNFAKDTAGDIKGFLSLWERAGNLNGKLKPLYKIDAGNMTRWRAEMEGRPDEIRYLREHGVDYRNPTHVRNFYVEERQKIQRVIVKVIREGEKQMTDRVQAFKKKGFEQVLDPAAVPGGMAPEDVELWLLVQQMRQQDPSYTLPDTVTLKDLSPYLAGGFSRHGN